MSQKHLTDSDTKRLAFDFSNGYQPIRYQDQEDVHFPLWLEFSVSVSVNEAEHGRNHAGDQISFRSLLSPAVSPTMQLLETYLYNFSLI